jgi:hypothetical protein
MEGREGTEEAAISLDFARAPAESVLMMRPFRLAPLFLALAAGASSAAPAKDAKDAGKKAAPASAPEVACDTQGEHYLIHVQGQAELPDGAIVRIACARADRGRGVEDVPWQIYAEVRGGAYKERYLTPRMSMKPGAYRIEVTLRETQREEVEKALTRDQRKFKQEGRLEMGAETPPTELAMEVCRPLATGLRAAGAASMEFAKHVASASEGKLASAAWKGWRSKAGLGAPLIADMEKAVARKEAAYYLPASGGLAPLVVRIRESLDACEATAAGKGTPETKKALETALLPTEDEATRALRPLYLDALGLWVTKADEITQGWGPTLEAGAQAQKKKDADQFVKAFGAFKALPWKGSYPIQFQLLDDILKDMKALAAARPAPAAGKDGRDAKDAKGGTETADAIVARLQNYVRTFRGALEAERTRK